MTDIKTQIKEFRIGEKIRTLRQQKRLTLQNLSELTTLSKPLLSQIENEQVIPPLATLLKISKGLKVGIHFFFEDEGNSQKYILTRSDEIQSQETVPRPVNDGFRPYVYHPLARGLRQKHMEPFLMEFVKQDWDDKLFYKHAGDEEFFYVTEGELDFHYNDEVINLKAGDSIYYDSSQPHGWVAAGGGKAKALAVLYTKD